MIVRLIRKGFVSEFIKKVEQNDYSEINLTGLTILIKSNI